MVGCLRGRTSLEGGEGVVEMQLSMSMSNMSEVPCTTSDLVM